jgi:hypothetical protein
MFSPKAFFLLAALLLLAGRSRAQSRADSPPPPPERVTVNVELPKAVGLLTDCTKIIFSRDEEDDDKLNRLVQRFRARKEKPVVTLQVEVPKNKVTKSLGIVE